MSEKPEALRLADSLRDGVPYDEAEIENELRRLHTDAEESEALLERLSALLRNTAIALRGPEPELTRWSWHDLPELAVALKAQRDALLEALKDIAGTDPVDAALDPQRAVRIARAAIKAVEEGK